MERWSDGAIERWNDGAMERWSDGAIERWNDGAMERWSDGAMERWNDGAMERWSDGALERWNDGALERWSVGTFSTDRRPQTADPRPQTADRRPQTPDRRPQTPDRRLHMWRDFPLARTPLGIVTAVFNRGICPYVTFLLRLQATIPIGEGHYMKLDYSGYKPLLRHPSTALQSGRQKSLHM
jgi:hypothetical protein